MKQPQQQEEKPEEKAGSVMPSPMAQLLTAMIPVAEGGSVLPVTDLLVDLMPRGGSAGDREQAAELVSQIRRASLAMEQLRNKSLEIMAGL